MGFLTKLIALLTPRKLAARFNVIPFLTVLDPEPEVKNAVSPSFYSCTLIFTFAVGHWICILHHSKPAFQQVFHFSSTTVLADVPTAVKVDYSEIIFIRLLHLLAHHPDFAVSLEQLSDFAK